jgi:hypothetical protein
MLASSWATARAALGFDRPLVDRLIHGGGRGLALGAIPLCVVEVRRRNEVRRDRIAVVSNELHHLFGLAVRHELVKRDERQRAILDVLSHLHYLLIASLRSDSPSPVSSFSAISGYTLPR